MPETRTNSEPTVSAIHQAAWLRDGCLVVLTPHGTGAKRVDAALISGAFQRVDSAPAELPSRP